MDDALKNQASEQKLGEKETKERIRYRQNNYFTALPFDFPATPCGYPPCPRAAAAEIYFTERERERESLLRELGYCAKGKKWVITQSKQRKDKWRKMYMLTSKFSSCTTQICSLSQTCEQCMENLYHTGSLNLHQHLHLLTRTVTSPALHNITCSVSPSAQACSRIVSCSTNKACGGRKHKIS